MPKDGFAVKCAREVVVKYRLLAGEGYDIPEKSRLFNRIVTSIEQEDQHSYFLQMCSPEVVSSKLAEFLTTCPCEEYSYAKHSSTWSSFRSSKIVREENAGKLSPDYNDRTKEHYKLGFKQVFGEVEKDFCDIKWKVEDDFSEAAKSEAKQSLTASYLKTLDTKLARRSFVKLEEARIRAGTEFDEAKYERDLETIKTVFKSADYVAIKEAWKAIVNEANDNVISPPPTPENWEFRMTSNLVLKKKSEGKTTQVTDKILSGGDDSEYDSPRGNSEMSSVVQLNVTNTLTQNTRN